MNTTWLYNKRFEFLLVSFLLLMFGTTYFTSPLAMHFVVTQNLLAGLVVFYRNKKLRLAIIVIILVHTAWVIGPIYNAWLRQNELKPKLYLLYFALVSYQVYKQIFNTKSVSAEMISAVMCGFILLCFISTFLFAEVENMQPNSFSNIGTGRDKLSYLNYFSVTTLLTVGFGDIVPLTLVAKRWVMLTALTGHFYTVFITAIVIGKYLNNKTSSD
jgi:voltage-gated potassium channel